MAEETKEIQEVTPTQRKKRPGEIRAERIAFAKSRSIVEVAEELGMELFRDGQDYRWKEHDSFVITPKTNLWNWFREHKGGDTLQLVQEMKGIDFNQAIDYLNDGQFKEADTKPIVKEEFRYYIGSYEDTSFTAGRAYLKNERGLSDETIDFFLNYGVLAQANAKVGDFIEPVISFKTLDEQGNITGASLQGLEYHPKRHSRGRLKTIMRNSDGLSGMHVDIGEPRQLVVAEAPIDLMSYYELHKGQLQNVRLLAMDGLKEGVISRHFMELEAKRQGSSYEVNVEKTPQALETLAKLGNYFEKTEHQNLITLAIDNDDSGRNFITSLQEKGIPVVIDVPVIAEADQRKMDWNEYLKSHKALSAISQDDMKHVYSLDDKGWHYQGYFTAEIVDRKVKGFFADEQIAFSSEKQLTNEEIQEQVKIAQEKLVSNQEEKVVDNSRLAQAERKLERLKREQDQAIEGAYDHQALTNGQPMNDKRGGAAWFKKQNQKEEKIFSLMEDIKKQEERVEYLREQESFKERGLNRRGSGLEISVQNIPRIKEEIEKAARGEANYAPSTIKRYKKELERLEAVQKQVETTTIAPSTQAIIDEGLVSQWKKNPTTYFVKGLRKVAFDLTTDGLFQISQKYRPKTEEEKEQVNKLLSRQEKEENKQEKNQEAREELAGFPDTKNLTPEEESFLRATWNDISFSVQPIKQAIIGEEGGESISHDEVGKTTSRRMSYDDVVHENKELANRLEKRIKSGELSISFGTDVYLYDVFRKLGNSYPLKYVNDKRMDVLAPIQSILASIDDKTVDLYKEKGTLEQDSLYQALKPHQRTLGVDISTRFIGELAISAYNTNKQIGSISREHFGAYYQGKTLDNLSQSIEQMLEYPLIESGSRDFTHGFVTIPNTFYHYLEQQSGELVINRNFLDTLISNIESHPIEIVNNSFSVHPTKQDVAREQEGYLIQFEYSESPVFSDLQKGERIPYKEFISKLYQANHVLYPTHIASLSDPPNNLLSDNYVPYQKSKFHLLSEDGEFVVSDIRYNIGEETETLGNLISRSELLELDQEVLKELGLEKVAEIKPVQELSRQKGQKEEKSMAEEIKKVPETLATVDREKLSQLLRTMEQYGSAGVLVPLAYGGSLKNQIGIVAYDDLLSGSYSDTVRFVFDYAHRHFDFPSFDEYYSHKHLDNLDYYKQFETQIKQFPIKEVMEKVIEEGILTHSQLQEYDKKTPENLQEAIVSNSEQQKSERTSQYKGSLQLEAEGSATPVLETSTFERSVTSRPTASSQYLHFTINGGMKSMRTKLEHSISQLELAKLNRFSNTLLEAAQFYRDHLANSKISYFTADRNIVQVNFLEENFMHLTGLKVVGEHQPPEKTLHDLALGGTVTYDDIRLANSDAAFSKIKVLPELEAVLQTDSFYFDHLESISRYEGRFNSLIKADDKDIMVLFRETDENNLVPASIFKVRPVLEVELENAQKNQILGIYRERDGVIEQISINQELVKDNGKMMLSILESRQYEEPSHEQSRTPNSPTETPIDASSFTQVLDAVYNVGAPQDLSLIPEEFHAAWNHYFELSKASQGDFKQVIRKAVQSNLLLTNSSFYIEWTQDRIYNENYHVRIKETENLPDGLKLPFNELDLIHYQTFAEELYKQNRIVYEQQKNIVEASSKKLEIDIPYAKVQFDVYAPGGELIKADAHYNIGEETEPISHLLALGYRHLEEHSDLSAIDERIFAQSEQISSEKIRMSDSSTERRNAEAVSPQNRQNSHQTVVVGNGNIVGRNGNVVTVNGNSIVGSTVINSTIISSNVGNIASHMGKPSSTEKIEKNLHDIADENGNVVGKNLDSNQTVSENQEKSRGLVETASNPERKLPSQEKNNDFDYKAASAQELSEQALQKIRAYSQNPDSLKEYLDFMSRFPKLSPRNVALIQAQWKGANAVATFNQWQALGEKLGLTAEDILVSEHTYTNKKTGKSRKVVRDQLSVKAGETSKIRLFRPVMVEMIPALDESGNRLLNVKGNPKFKRLKDATKDEKKALQEGKINSQVFQDIDNAGNPKFTTYNVFELSQTTLKPESYPKAMPNRHYDFNVDQVRTKEVMKGLENYATNLGVTLKADENHVLGNARGAFYPDKQEILLNSANTAGEKIATTIHELAHATLHNPKFDGTYKESEEMTKGRKELEAEMSSYLISKHFGLDTDEKSLSYMATWTKNLQALDDTQLNCSMKRVHRMVAQVIKTVEKETKPFDLAPKLQRGPRPKKMPQVNKGPKL